jgi:hypothetical protein
MFQIKSLPKVTYATHTNFILLTGGGGEQTKKERKKPTSLTVKIIIFIISINDVDE